MTEMIQINIRMENELYDAVFSLAYRETGLTRKRVSMNEIIRRALKAYKPISERIEESKKEGK